MHGAQFAFSNGPALSNGQAPAPAPAAAEAPMPAEEDLPFRPRLACLVRVCVTHYARTHAQAPVLSSEDINISDAPLRQASEAKEPGQGQKGEGRFSFIYFLYGKEERWDRD